MAGCATPPDVPTSVLFQGAGDPAPPASPAMAKVGREEESLLLRRLSRIEDGIDAKLVGGNRAQLLIDGPQTHAAMLKAMRAARHHIHIETYILEAREEFTAVLMSKRAEGVQVSVLYDAIGSMATAEEYFARLEAAGVALCRFNPVNPLKSEKGKTLNNRDHRKLLIVDGKTAFTGGINISGTYSRGSFSKSGKPAADDNESKIESGWRDTHLLINGPVVADIQRLFLDAWQRQDCPVISPSHAFPVLRKEGNQTMRLVAADPAQAQSELYVALMLAIAHARQRAWLTYGYFVPDEKMLQALIDASRRGVDVRLVLPGFSDFWATFHAGRSHYTDLLAAGVRIFERRDALVHAKTAVIDGVWSCVGSTNLDWRSFVSNYEADVIVLDRDFAAQLENLFRMDVSASHEITAEEWEQRGLLNRLKEWFARQWERLL